MTVGTAARNNSPSWLTISTDYAKAPDHTPAKCVSGIPEVHTRSHKSCSNKGVIL